MRKYIRIITWQGEIIQDIAEVEYGSLTELTRKDGTFKRFMSNLFLLAIENGDQVTIEKGEYK